MAKKYKTSLLMLEENLEMLKGELYTFEFKARKKAAINARQILLNIKKLCHNLRLEINDDIKHRHVVKKNITPEAIAIAKEKRRKTNELKKALE